MSDQSSAVSLSNAVHKVNGALLRFLKKELFTAWVWKEIIANVILIHVETEYAQTSSLVTSATIHSGTVFDEPRSGHDAPVERLNGRVPFNMSLTGHCLRSGNVVWINNLSELPDTDMLGALYRDFSYVGVWPDRDLPRAEYVFPIRAAFGLNSLVLGALNIEWYPKPGRRTASFAEGEGKVKSPFGSAAKPSTVQALLLEVLDTHAPFIMIAAKAQDGDQEPLAWILQAHERILSEHGERWKRIAHG